LRIKEKFEQCTTRDMLLLYLIVVMIYSLVYIFYDNLSRVLFVHQVKKSSLVIPTKKTLQKIKKLSDLEMIEYFNINAKKYKLYSTGLKISQNTIDFKGKGTFINTMTFLNKVEKNFILKRFDIKYSDDIEVTLIISKEYLSDSISKVEMLPKLSNPFVLKKEIQSSFPKSIDITAIMDFEILVDNNWYKKDDMISQYKVLSIYKDKVILLDTQSNENVTKSISYE
jgi:hypothetical protein